jgi:putative FmdB family regulatory protein
MNIDSVSLYEILSAYQAVDRGYLPNHMPYYEYRCNNCGRNVRKFYTYAEFDTVQPECNHCGSDNLRRLISRVALAKSEESRMESMDPDRMMAGLDEEDPRSLGRFMRKMGSEMGEDLGDEFGEVVGRLESGESPESIEESMPDLAASGGGDLPGGDLGLG